MLAEPGEEQALVSYLGEPGGPLARAQDDLVVDDGRLRGICSVVDAG